MKFVSLGEETLALFLAPPDWDREVTVELGLPTDLARAKTGRVSARNFASSFRYSLGYTALFPDARSSTDFAQWLLRLKEETVAVPLWTDYVEATSAFNAGGTQTLALAYGPSVRAGADWIILSEDGNTFELVTASSVGSSTITLASTTLNWPAGTRLYPLLFGELTQRPEANELTDEISEAALKFEENSDYARRLSTIAASLPTVGAGIAEFSAMRLWNIEPHFERPLTRTEIDILYRQIGYGRKKQKRVRSRYVRRGSEKTYTPFSRVEISAIERFFRDRRANVLPFLAPTWRGDLRLTQDLPITGNASLMTVETTRYTDPDYSTAHPGAPYFALIQRGLAGAAPTVTPVRVNSSQIDGLHLDAPIAIAQSKDATILSHLLLVRFAESKLSWSYGSDGVATTKLRTIEAPDEYATPNAALPAPAFLYKFHSLGTVLGRFTSYENTIPWSSQTWTPGPFLHDTIKRTLDLSDSTELSSWGSPSDFANNPLRKFLPLSLESDLMLEITEVNADNPDDGSAERLFTGKVKEPRVKGDELSATVVAFDFHSETKYPRFVVQKSDNFMPFTRPTQLDEEDYREDATITSLDGFTAHIGAADHDDQYYRGGMIETGTGESYEARFIIHSLALGLGRHQLSLNRPFLQAEVGDSCTVLPGYDGSLEQCVNKFGNLINFGGHPFAPDSGPQIKIEEAAETTGGKK